MTLTYAELVEQAEAHREVFGRMLLSWRRRNGWTQYTACHWGQEVGFEMISYGNLSVIEQGKAGELRQKAFWQLGELNQRIAAQDWGPIQTRLLKERVMAAEPLGDTECPVWGPLEFWACYCGLRPVPESYRQTPAPSIGQRKATELSRRWRQQARDRVLQLQQASPEITPQAALGDLVNLAAVEHRDNFYAVLIGFADYRPDQLAGLWQRDGRYLPEIWLQQWQQALGG
jgi:hypothetical protein